MISGTDVPEGAPLFELLLLNLTCSCVVPSRLEGVPSVPSAPAGLFFLFGTIDVIALSELESGGIDINDYSTISTPTVRKIKIICDEFLSNWLSV